MRLIGDTGVTVNGISTTVGVYEGDEKVIEDNLYKLTAMEGDRPYTNDSEWEHGMSMQLTTEEVKNLYFLVMNHEGRDSGAKD